MSDPGVGFEYPRQKVSWLKRDLLLFANSIGAKADELHLLYELHPEFTAFPTYPVILSKHTAGVAVVTVRAMYANGKTPLPDFKGDTQEVIDFFANNEAVQIPGIPKLDYKRLVDGQRKIEFLRPLPTSSEGRHFETRTKVVGVYDKGKPGTVLDVETELVDADSNTVYTRIHSSSFFIGQGNWGGPKGPATVSYPPPKDKKPDAVIHHQTTSETALLYRLNGDYNPLHATPEPGHNMGFGGVIIHGLYSWNSTCLEIVRALGASNPANIRQYQARFATPVKPGDKLITHVWKTGEKRGEWEEIRFVTQVEEGKVCLSNGRALMKTVGEPKSRL